jgi:hypothetical protein
MYSCRCRTVALLTGACIAPTPARVAPAVVANMVSCPLAGYAAEYISCKLLLATLPVCIAEFQHCARHHSMHVLNTMHVHVLSAMRKRDKRVAQARRSASTLGEPCSWVLCPAAGICAWGVVLRGSVRAYPWRCHSQRIRRCCPKRCTLEASWLDLHHHRPGFWCHAGMPAWPHLRCPASC